SPRRVLGSLFFFSSRRRHTRSKRDWSSDVCSSDLHIFPVLPPDLLTRADNGSRCTPNPWGKSMWIKEQKKQFCIMAEVYYLPESRKCKELFLKETLCGYLARTAC